MALPGVQVLFAFLLVLPFQQSFAEITDLERQVYYLAFASTAAAWSARSWRMRPRAAAPKITRVLSWPVRPNGAEGSTASTLRADHAVRSRWCAGAAPPALSRR